MRAWSSVATRSACPRHRDLFDGSASSGEHHLTEGGATIVHRDHTFRFDPLRPSLLHSPAGSPTKLNPDSPATIWIQEQRVTRAQLGQSRKTKKLANMGQVREQFIADRDLDSDDDLDDVSVAGSMHSSSSSSGSRSRPTSASTVRSSMSSASAADLSRFVEVSSQSEQNARFLGPAYMSHTTKKKNRRSQEEGYTLDDVRWQTAVASIGGLKLGQPTKPREGRLEPDGSLPTMPLYSPVKYAGPVRREAKKESRYDACSDLPRLPPRRDTCMSMLR